MRKITSIIIITFGFLIFDSFSQSISWFRSYYRTGNEEAGAIVQTYDNGYILGAHTTLGLGAMRLNIYGDTIWYRILPGSAGTDIIKTNDNNYIVLDGYSIVTKIDINGNIIWTKGPFNPDAITFSMREESNGNLIISGGKDTLGIYVKPYLLKLNSNGDMIWQKIYGINIHDGNFAYINLAYDNNYLLTGVFSNNDSLNDKLFFTKADTAGNPIFFYGYDTLKYCYGKFIQQIGQSSYMIGGRYGRPFLTKINSTGTIQWFYRYLNSNLNSCYAVTNTYDMGYALTGYWDTAGTNIEHHAFLIKTDSSGVEQFRKVYLYAPLDGNYGYDIKQTSDSGYIITGTRVNYNIYDIMVIKTDKNGLTQIIGISPIGSTIPLNFKLHQNYPNPFNPSTRIKFEVAVSAEVKIILYDVLGREIKKILDDFLMPGIYEINFNSSSLASGVYYYSLFADVPSLSLGQGFRETKKMILLR